MESREFRTAPVVGGPALLLSYLVIGWIPALCVREVLVTRQPVDEIIQLLSVAAMAVFVLGWLTYSWLEYRHFGQSVCRLLTLPMTSETSFEAEVECNLPLESRAPVVVRLRSQAPLGKVPRRHWEVEQHVAPDEIRPLGGKRAIVPVRLSVPGSAGRPAAGGLNPVWTLEVSRRSPGMNFHAQFIVPVEDPPKP